MSAPDPRSAEAMHMLDQALGPAEAAIDHLVAAHREAERVHGNTMALALTNVSVTMALSSPNNMVATVFALLVARLASIAAVTDDMTGEQA